MVARATVWPETAEGLLELVRPLAEKGFSQPQAAEALGKTEAQLQGALRHKRIRWRDLLDRAPVVAPVAFQDVGSSKQGPTDRNNERPLALDWTGARPASTGLDVERRIVIGDLHFPYAKLRSLMLALAVVRAVQPRRIIQLGDVLNMGAVSRFPVPLGGREKHESAVVRAASFFEALRRACPGAEIDVLAGNHEIWGDEFENANPAFAGMVSVGAQKLGLDRIGARYHSVVSQPLVLGPVAYQHGTGGGVHYCRRYAQMNAPRAGVKCIVVGHHHSFQHFHERNACEAWGAGWLGDESAHAFDYAKPPRGWETGVLLQDVCGDLVTTTPIRFDGGRALVAGRLVAA